MDVVFISFYCCLVAVAAVVAVVAVATASPTTVLVVCHSFKSTCQLRLNESDLTVVRIVFIVAMVDNDDNDGTGAGTICGGRALQKH